MKLDFIDLGNLSIAAANMRGKGKDPDVTDLLPSVRARGVLVPLLVRPNCSEGRFEIIAGRRRFTAVNAVAREGGTPRRFGGAGLYAARRLRPPLGRDPR